MNLRMPPPRFETRAVLSLSGIFCFRMLGLFIILPVFTLSAPHFRGATPSLIGMALGVYGLTQAILQIPLAMLSDKCGRKVVIVGGLLIFIAGSVVAALSQSIQGVIIGRALQGAGAVGSTVIALLADVTRVENRTKAMAIIGMTIGFSFALAIVLGPALNSLIGLSGIFWFTGFLGFVSILMALLGVPKPPRQIFHREAEALPALLKRTLFNLELLRLDFGIMALHVVLTSSFIAIPLLLLQKSHHAEQMAWLIYLPVMVIAFLAVTPLIIVAEKYRRLKFFFIAAIVVLVISMLIWQINSTLWVFALGLALFFTAFTFLEATLPSLVSKVAPVASKGTAIGVYSSAQFFGIFLGGSLGGWVYSHYHFTGIFIGNLLLLGLWLLVATTMRQPPYLSTFMLAVGDLSDHEAQKLSKRLLELTGVGEAIVMPAEKLACLKIDKRLFNIAELDDLQIKTTF